MYSDIQGACEDLWGKVRLDVAWRKRGQSTSLAAEGFEHVLVAEPGSFCTQWDAFGNRRASVPITWADRSSL